MKDYVADAKDRMIHAVEATQRDFNTVRTGRASPGMLDRILVDAYGSQMPVNQLANITVPEPRQLLIQPFDRGTTQAIEKSIQKSDLGINPIVDGQGIRLTIPPMTEERRKELVKQIHARAEEGCVAVRNVRRDAIEHLKKAEKGKEISEDELKRHEVEVQKLTDKYVDEIHALQKKKDAELMEV
jgi:ribosome recycling factor